MHNPTLDLTGQKHFIIKKIVEQLKKNKNRSAIMK